MALAALIVSIVSLLVAVGFTIRGEVRESSRRHDELAPRLTATYDANDGERLQFIRLVNAGPLPYASVAVTLVQPQYGWPERFNGLLAVDTEDGEPEHATTVVTHPLPVGEVALIGLVESGKQADTDATIRLRCVCTEKRRWRKARQWDDVLVEVDAPGVPRGNVW